MTSLATLSARVTGFEYNTFCAYKTVVSVDGVSWTLRIRYSKFLAFYDQFRAADRSFKFSFPPKGGIFSTPKPEDRQPRLSAFLQAAIAFYLKKKQPRTLTKLLSEFLQVEKKMKEARKAPKSKDEKSSGGKDKSLGALKPKEEKSKPSGKAQEDKKAIVDAASTATVASGIKDNAMKATKGEESDGKPTTAPKEIKADEQKEFTKTTGDPKVLVKNEDVKVEVEDKKEATLEEAVEKVEKKVEVDVDQAKDEVKVEDVKVETKKAETKVEETNEEETTVEETMVEETNEEVKVVNAKQEVTAEETKIVETEQMKVKSEELTAEVEKYEVQEVKTESVNPIPSSTTTTTTTTTSNGSTVVETNVTSQLSPTKIVVGKTVTITSNSDDSHSFKVELSEKKASVVTLSTVSNEFPEDGESKGKKKKRNRKKSVSQPPLSSASTVSDGFESPDGVDDVSRVSDPNDSQKKSRNQRRKEKRKKKQKKDRFSEVEA